MNKFFTLLVACATTFLSASAQSGHGAMTFAGPSSFHVTMNGQTMGQTALPSDTIIYAGSDFTLPTMKYGNMVIPSFTIKNTTFSGGYAGVTWNDQTFQTSVVDASGAEKQITGSSLRGSFTHEEGIYKLQLEVTFSYGTMPMPITYSIESYYIKEYAGENVVTVGDNYGPYKANVAYKVRTYQADGQTKMDVEVPTYGLTETVMGDLTLGGYTVQGLTYDESRTGYYKDYASDGLTMHFKAESKGHVTMDQNYALSAADCENILVELKNGHAQITNHFLPGSMPFPITAVMTQGNVDAISSVSASQVQTDAATYNLQGQRVSPTTRGLIIRGGKKYYVK